MSRPYIRTAAFSEAEVARFRDEFVTVKHAWDKLQPFLLNVKWHAFRQALAGKPQTPAVLDAIRTARQMQRATAAVPPFAP